ncbi:MAG: nucleotide exchange factor GrpE [Prolixibacteraceae bacterium]|nr:nucleotide exchange factor GrpE [Prolixibacteraceae bacterium]
MAEDKNIRNEQEAPVNKESTEEKNNTASEESNEDQKKNKKKAERKPQKDKREEKIESLENELASISDKHLRLQAEFDNYRRRTLKEKAELIKSGGENILMNILPVIDDFDRALDSMKEIDDDNPAKQGTLLIYNKFREFLKQNNVKEIDALKQEFDCEIHEAVTKIPAGSYDLKGKNVDVIQKGYTLNDKVIRFAKVVVGE